MYLCAGGSITLVAMEQYEFSCMAGPAHGLSICRHSLVGMQVPGSIVVNDHLWAGASALAPVDPLISPLLLLRRLHALLLSVLVRFYGCSHLVSPQVRMYSRMAISAPKHWGKPEEGVSMWANARPGEERFTNVAVECVPAHHQMVTTGWMCRP